MNITRISIYVWLTRLDLCHSSMGWPHDGFCMVTVSQVDLSVASLELSVRLAGPDPGFAKSVGQVSKLRENWLIWPKNRLNLHDLVVKRGGWGRIGPYLDLPLAGNWSCFAVMGNAVKPSFRWASSHLGLWPLTLPFIAFFWISCVLLSDNVAKVF